MTDYEEMTPDEQAEYDAWLADHADSYEPDDFPDPEEADRAEGRYTKWLQGE